ncbi:transporter substrate-binding domain-containing protein [Lederbergia lenta]|uniref:Family 3 extracellular solute-binding protein n=1 Tax=Lederbergia lenta TaxID=1467 RepID=A0A2X4VUW7_LEDLE|nr:transporter substrate-binding domain-containing protein [Lederbergia lenta]MCM3112643.1 transporter substrate-binding domain-containing protein [Lederbergia lenta]MEC2323682.1 transporter substrate-binding domain-containing protein [Lederbergia lenta]SQI51638.1 family 3 extracellular solute-binding protein [Lederbergia lenta]
MRKRIFFLLAALSLLLVLTACGNSSADGKGKTYTVATDSNFKPFEYKNPKTGELEGFDIEIIEEIADRAGFKVKFETMDFDGVLAGLQSGRFPIGIAGMSITEERKESIDFSIPYYDSGLVMMVPNDSDIQSIDDVDGKKIGSRQGSTSQAYLQENTGAKVEAFPEIVTAYMDVKEGRLDGALYDLPNVLYYMNQEGDDKLKTVGDVLEGQSYGIALKKDSEIVDDVNQALESMIADGTYAKIYEKFFGEAPGDKWLGE